MRIKQKKGICNIEIHGEQAGARALTRSLLCFLLMMIHSFFFVFFSQVFSLSHCPVTLDVAGCGDDFFAIRRRFERSQIVDVPMLLQLVSFFCLWVLCGVLVSEIKANNSIQRQFPRFEKAHHQYHKPSVTEVQLQTKPNFTGAKKSHTQREKNAKKREWQNLENHVDYNNNLEVPEFKRRVTKKKHTHTRGSSWCGESRATLTHNILLIISFHLLFVIHFGDKITLSRANTGCVCYYVCVCRGVDVGVSLDFIGKLGNINLRPTINFCGKLKCSAEPNRCRRQRQ